VHIIHNKTNPQDMDIKKNCAQTISRPIVNTIDTKESQLTLKLNAFGYVVFSFLAPDMSGEIFFN
jgi:hypothetical protein